MCARIGRPAEVQGFGDGEEAIELAQIHGGGPFWRGRGGGLIDRKSRLI